MVSSKQTQRQIVDTFPFCMYEAILISNYRIDELMAHKYYGLISSYSEIMGRYCRDNYVSVTEYIELTQNG